MSINREDKIKYLENIIRDARAFGTDIFGWLVDNWDKIDFSQASTYLTDKMEQDRLDAVASLKQRLKDLGEEDPYLDK